MAKPPITPIQVNRDAESEYFKMVKERKVNEIQPVFPDYKKDIQSGELDKKIESHIYCVKNVENQYFSLQIVYEEGELTRRELPIATAYVNYLGTSALTAGWLNARKTQYALKNGSLATGRVKIDGQYYLFDGSGIKQTNTLRRSGMRRLSQ